jgi:6-phosphogluconolactonase
MHANSVPPEIGFMPQPTKSFFFSASLAALLAICLAITGCGSSSSSTTHGCTGTCVPGAFLFVATPAQVYGYAPLTAGPLTSPISTSPSAASAPSIAVTPNSNFLFEPDLIFHSVLAFSIDNLTGALTLLATHPLGPSSQGGVGSAITPTGSALYVSDMNGDVLGFRIASGGALTGLTGSLLPSSQRPHLLAIDPAGKYLYANDPNDQVLVYAIQADGSLVPVPGSPFKVATGSDPQSLAVDSSGKFLYVTLAKAGKVAGFAINANTGALTPVPSSPFPAGRQPAALGITPNHFLYVINGLDNSISAYQINSMSGQLTEATGSPFPAGTPINSELVVPFPGSVASDHTGLRLWIAAPWSTSVASFSINGTTGALSPLGIANLPANTPPGYLDLAFYNP